ncbi:MAG: hypothetical protein KAV87_28120 [Desulfobacteraceae bacterium]|nr:hypothetical protein [Desulfobacteraceae bacterium]
MVDGTILSEIQDLLKFVYGTGLTQQFPLEVITYNQFTTSTRKPTGLGYKFGMNIANPQGIGARQDGAILPDPLPGKQDNGLIVPAFNYGVLRTSGPAIELGKGDMAAFIDTLSGDVRRIYEGLLHDLNRQSWGDGFGKMATLSAASDSLSTTATWTATCDNQLGTTYLQEGMVIDFYNSAGAIDQSAVASRISGINLDTNVVTFEANDGTYKTNHPIVAARSYTIATDTVPAASQIVRYGARDAAFATSDTPIEMIGLEGIYDDGTLLSSFEGITVSSQDKWKANILSNSSVDRELSIDLMLRACDRGRKRSGMATNCIRMGLGQRRKYANLLINDVRFSPQNLKGGYEVLTFSGGDGSVDMVIDPVAQPGKMYFEPNGVIQKYEATSLGWSNLDGAQLSRRQGYDQFDQFLRLYSNLGCENRNSLTKITDLVEPDA